MSVLPPLTYPLRYRPRSESTVRKAGRCFKQTPIAVFHRFRILTATDPPVKLPVQSSILHGIDPDVSARAAAGRDGQVETVEAFSLPSKVTRRARAHDGRNLGKQRILVRIILLKDVDVSLASRHVDALVLGSFDIDSMSLSPLRVKGNGIGAVKSVRGKSS